MDNVFHLKYSADKGDSNKFRTLSHHGIIHYPIMKLSINRFQ